MAERRFRARILAAGFGVAAALAATIARPPRPFLVWNASASAPIGLYRVYGRAFVRGDMVVAWPPSSIRALAARRDYLPLGVPLVKRVAALPGDTVCAEGRAVSIDGRRVALRLSRDSAGRPLPWWSGCRRLGAGSVLLLGARGARSFDGRYFGPSPARDIIGKASLLWPG